MSVRNRGRGLGHASRKPQGQAAGGGTVPPVTADPFIDLNFVEELYSLNGVGRTRANSVVDPGEDWPTPAATEANFQEFQGFNAFSSTEDAANAAIKLHADLFAALPAEGFVVVLDTIWYRTVPEDGAIFARLEWVRLPDRTPGVWVGLAANGPQGQTIVQDQDYGTIVGSGVVEQDLLGRVGAIIERIAPRNYGSTDGSVAESSGPLDGVDYSLVTDAVLFVSVGPGGGAAGGRQVTIRRVRFYNLDDVSPAQLASLTALD